MSAHPFDNDGMVEFEEIGSHFHPCSKCRAPYECWCPFPEITPCDSLAVCDECRAKQ